MDCVPGVLYQVSYEIESGGTNEENDNEYGDDIELSDEVSGPRLHSHLRTQ